MRISELHQRRFGRFTDDTLELIPSDDTSVIPGLHVVYGPNEAGKTTTLHAIRYGLYGIPDLRNDPRTYDFLHRKPDLRIGMVVDSAAGARIGFTRRKKAGDTCFDITDTTAAPELQQQLDGLLRGIDRNLFAYKYGIDRETLRRGGEGLAGDDNDLGESLFAAATGIVGVRTTLNSLAAQIDDLLKSTGRSGKIHEAVKRYNDARAATEKARRAGRGWWPKQKEIEQAKSSLETLNSALATAKAEHRRASAIDEAIELVVRRRLVLEQIDELGDVIDAWSVDLEEQRKDLRSTLTTAEAALLAANGDLTAQETRRTELAAAVDDALLGSIDRTKTLVERIAEYLTANGERSKHAASLKAAQQAVATACLAIQTGADPDRARELIPPLPDREAARALLVLHADLVRDAAEAAGRLRDCDEALLTFEAEASATPAVPDGFDVVRTAAKRIETVDTALLAQLEARLGTKSKTLGDAATALPRCAHPAETLLALAAPLEQTIGAFDERLRAAQRTVEQLEAARSASIDALKEADAGIAAKSAGRDVPALKELEVLRDNRDSLWRRIRRAWTGAPAIHEEEMIAAGAEARIASDFEDVVASVDRHGDRMISAGEILGAITALQSHRAGVETERDRQEAELTTARVELLEVKAEWQALWAAIEVEPGTIAEMRAWLDALRDVREIAASAESDSVDAQALRARVKRARNDLAAALTAAGRPPASDEISVEILQATATEMLEAADRAREAAVKRDADRRNLEGNRERARSRETAAREALHTWRHQWDETAPSVGLEVGALPEAGIALLEAVGTLEMALRDLMKEQAAREGNDLVITTFEADVEDLITSLGAGHVQELAGRTADQAVREIAEAAQVCATASVALLALGPQIEKLEDQVREQQHRVRSATDGLAQLVSSAGLAGAEELAMAAALWAQREGMRVELKAVEQTIVEVTKMAPLKVVDYLGDTLPELLPALIAQRATAVEDATGLRDAMNDTLGGLQRELGELQGAARAEPHLADMDDARAEIEQLAAQYVPLRLQHDLLTSYLREKAGEHMGPAMKRAGTIFQELTCGDYVGLTQDVDEADREVLQVIPDGDGKSRLDRSGLSTGTSDQLYLALRVASIYQHLEAPSNEPIPFIVDDILTSFDDDRSAATMRVLGELATHTQVLFFTHHQHLVDLARAEVSPDVLRMHVLG